MFTKFKHALEKWIRAIVADEVGRIDRDLQGERAALRAHIATVDEAFKAHFQSFDDVVRHLSEVKENALLQEHIKKLHAQITVISDLFNKLHPSVK